MPIIGFPFDNVAYDASALGAWLCTRTRGVFAADGHYTVAIDGDLSVSVSSGVAWLQMGSQWGVVAPNAASVSLPVAAGDGSLNRIDAVCLRINKNTSAIELLVKQGDLAAAPVIPAIERDLDYDEIYLATISVPAGTTELTAAQLTDQRLNAEYCGVMRDGVTGIPTAQIQAQAEALMQILRNEIANINAGSEMMLKTEYAPDATATMAGGVLTVTSTYAHPGTDYDVRFVAPDGFDGADTFTLDGATVTVRGADMEESSLEAAPGAVVNLSRHGDDVFPKSGGGIGYKVLAAASAAALPVNAKDNTLVVITTQAIAEYYLSDTEPTMRADGTALSGGEVWFDCSAGPNGLWPFSPNARDAALIYRMNGVYQYSGTAWVRRDAYLAKAGAWKPIGVFYRNGTQYAPFTTTQSGRGTVSFNSTNIQLTKTSGGAGSSFLTIEEIDLTTIKSAYMTVGSITGSGDGIAFRILKNNAIAKDFILGLSSSAQTLEFDLSDVYGICDIKIGGDTAASTRIWGMSITEIRI